MKFMLVACCVTMGTLALAACDAKANPLFEPAAAVYQAEPKGDQGVSSRCAKIVNPAERRKCILTSG